MKYVTETPLEYFDFWGGARDVARLLKSKEFEEIEEWLTDLADDTGVEFLETEINDFFWFDSDFLAEIIGYDSFDELYEERRCK